MAEDEEDEIVIGDLGDAGVERRGQNDLEEGRVKEEEPPPKSALKVVQDVPAGVAISKLADGVSVGV